MKIFLIAILIIMVLLTGITYLPNSSLIGGSVSSMEEIAKIKIVIPTILIIIFLCLLYYYFKSHKKVTILLLALTFLLWLFSGRTISLITFPDAKINVGWFYIPTGGINLCDYKTDCETVVDYQTKIKTLFFWRLNIKNGSVDKTVFIGPFLWNNATKLLNSKVGAGTYTK